MSAQFNNMLLTGGALNFAEGDIHFNSSGKSVTDKGIGYLFSKAAPGAFHDSGERFDAPKCHPNTRVAVIQEILDWLDDLESSELAMWLHGAAGAGKSAIAQTIAQILFEQGRLSGSFFFARGSTTGRDDEKKLIPTLAYQLAKYRPETRAHIAEAVISDPGIFNLTLLSQVQSLLIKPLWIASNAISSPFKASSRLFIIDGLDECRDPDAQCRILQVFTAAVKSMQHHLPHKLLIASRSEIHILAGFNERNLTAMCHRLPLDNSYHRDDDIRLFLQDSFSKIKGEHRMRAYLEHSWPSKEIISSLVRKSSGQFIYASTVVKFVSSARHHPAERLKIILGLKTPGHNDRPFAALDSLYNHIFQSAEDIELVLCIMRITLGESFGGIPRPVSGGEEYRTVIGISAEELELALGDLVSVIRFDRETGWFTFLHASIPDFLLDPHRSRTFYIDQPKVNLCRAECCVKAICNIYRNKRRAIVSPYSLAWAHLSDCTGRLVDPADKQLLYKSLSSLEMRHALDYYFLDLGRFPDDSFKPIGRLLLWCLQEQQTYPEKATLLLKLTHQFDVWFLSHLQTVSINGFDNDLGIDLMVFTMTQFGGDGTLIEHRLNILGVVENSTPTPSAELLTALGTPSAPDKANLLFPWYYWTYAGQKSEYFMLLHHFFHDLKRAGKYFMSGDRYANAALHCVYFLFDTRQDYIKNWDKPRWVLERETLYLALEYTIFFLGRATAAKDLFDLLLVGVTIPKGSSGLSTIISAIETNARCRLNSRIDTIFAIDQSTSLGVQCVNNMFDRIFVSRHKTVAQWQEESVQRVTTAVSEYVSTLEAQKIIEEALKKRGKESNTLVTGGAFDFAAGNILIKGSALADKGIAKLFLKVASGAFHDSRELLDSLIVECHPNTRAASIQEILDWLDDSESPELVMWLHGASGAGKSAIAQTIAQILFEQRRLSGSFFFAQGSTTGRDDSRRLVPTLAYQLAKYWPETRAHISKAVLSDPAIFNLALHRQVQDLLINPLRNALNAVSSTSSTSPRLYIIAGLDECCGADVQCLILKVFAAAIKSIQHQLPHKLLITSQPEMHLLTGFNNTATKYRQLSLDMLMFQEAVGAYTLVV